MSALPPRRASFLRACRPLGLCLALAATAPLYPAAGDDEILRARIRDMIEGVKDVPLPVIVEAVSGRRVIPWAGEERAALEAVAEEVRASIERLGIEAARVNEAGNRVEEFVLVALRESGFAADRPIGPSGRKRTAGYPDLTASRGGAEFYVEVKAYSAASVDSAQRSFYLSPSTDFKVTRDAHHLLIAVELASGANGRYRAVAARWLDLSRLRCDLKYEFNASNRDLYRPESGLVVIERREPPAATTPPATVP